MHSRLYLSQRITVSIEFRFMGMNESVSKQVVNDNTHTQAFYQSLKVRATQDAQTTPTVCAQREVRSSTLNRPRRAPQWKAFAYSSLAVAVARAPLLPHRPPAHTSPATCDALSAIGPVTEAPWRPAQQTPRLSDHQPCPAWCGSCSRCTCTDHCTVVLPDSTRSTF